MLAKQGHDILKEKVGLLNAHFFFFPYTYVYKVVHVLRNRDSTLILHMPTVGNGLHFLLSLPFVTKTVKGWG